MGEIYSIEEVVRMLHKLENQMTAGFNGVHARQDKTNNKVAENTAFRYKIMGGAAVITAIGISSLVGVILLWLKIIVK